MKFLKGSCDKFAKLKDGRTWERKAKLGELDTIKNAFKSMQASLYSNWD